MLALLVIFIGVKIEQTSHFFTQHASYFYGVLGMGYGLVFGIRLLLEKLKGDKDD